METRIVFDLDGTLLTGDFSLEHEYFKNLYGDKAVKFLDNVIYDLDEYEHKHKKYEIDTLSKFLTLKNGFFVSEKDIEGWIECNRSISETYEEGIVETLEYLKHKDYNLVLLTNWFKRTQEQRLINTDLLKYFDEMYYGDDALKPHQESYYMAIGNMSYDQCVFIGDNLEKDYIGPRKIGAKSIFYDKFDRQHGIEKVKKINEIIERY